MLMNPIHFFDESGVSALRREALEKQVASLTDENDRLKRLVDAMQRKLAATEPEIERVTH